MSGGRTISLALGLMALSACASAGPHTTSGPSAPVSGNLKICPGGGVSNAPSTNRNGEVANFTPYTEVRGVVLARAPVQACISSGFGPRRGGAGRFHHGLDLYTGNPAPIYASGDGVIEDVQSMRGYGRTVTIRHSARVKTRYAHLSSYAKGLRRGGRIRQGDLIGRTGATGNATAVHLHYEILVNGKAQNPLTVGR